MAKRFIDTGLFDDSWFMDLSKDSKLLWLYLITKCDHAGIIDFNEKLCKTQTGIENIDEALKGLATRYLRVREQYVFILKFISYQYPNFPNSAVRSQISAINRLREFDIDVNSLNPKLRVSKGLANSYEHEHEHGCGYGYEKKGGVGEKIDLDNLYNTQWFESIISFLQSKITFDELQEYWSQYKKAMIADDDMYRDSKDYRAHFRNWVKIQTEKKTKYQTGIVKRFKVFKDEEARTI